jgi:hypothetical protein
MLSLPSRLFSGHICVLLAKFGASLHRQLPGCRKLAPPLFSPQELENLDDEALRSLYEIRVAEQRAAAGREDFSGEQAQKHVGARHARSLLCASSGCMPTSSCNAISMFFPMLCRHGGCKGRATKAQGSREGRRRRQAEQVQVLIKPTNTVAVALLTNLQ